MKPIAVVDEVKKQYSHSSRKSMRYGIRDLFREWFARNSGRALRPDEFYAVDNVSFCLNAGDSMAFIGRNGSGKTTLLKLMHGLVKPDAGTIITYGKVQALVNLGAGFNPALSGRDNIYNSAALRGLGRKAASSIVDQVVEFSELEEFIDSPVGTYSSGMHARLGFSVAINLDPDLLLIDEILAVGDYAFRNKCLVRMHQLKKSGVSIVLVSHSPTDVAQLCDTALWLDHGKPRKLGPAKETLREYLAFLDMQEAAKLRNLRKEAEKKIEEKQKSAKPQLYGPIYDEFDRVEDVELRLRANGRQADNLHVHDEVTIEYNFTLKDRVTDLNVSLVIYKEDGLPVTTISTLNGDLLKGIHEGRVSCAVKIPDFNLNPGSYVLVMPIHEGKSYLYRNVMKEFFVASSGRLTWHSLDLRHEYRIGE